MTATLPDRDPAPGVRTLRIIDCDVHPLTPREHQQSAAIAGTMPTMTMPENAREWYSLGDAGR